MREEEEKLYRRTHDQSTDSEERRLKSAFKPEDFHFLKVLGKGSFGKASRCYSIVSWITRLVMRMFWMQTF